MRLMATLAVVVICLPMSGFAQNKPDVEELLHMIEDLQGQIDSIELIPGPRGPAGYTGPAGPAGPAGAGALFEYVGTAGTPFDGGGGIGEFSRACHAAIPGSRMCTSEEVFFTVNPPQFPMMNAAAPFAWVQPILAADTYNGRLTIFPGVGQARSGSAQMNCTGWTEGYPGQEGLALDLSIGSFFPMECHTELDVACCAPVASP